MEDEVDNPVSFDDADVKTIPSEFGGNEKDGVQAEPGDSTMVDNTANTVTMNQEYSSSPTTVATDLKEEVSDVSASAKDMSNRKRNDTVFWVAALAGLAWYFNQK